MWKSIFSGFIFLIRNNYIKSAFKLKYEHIYNKKQKHVKY